MIVSNEGLLNILRIKQQYVLLYQLAVLIFPFLVCISCVKVVLFWGHERSLQSLVEEVVPREVAQPGMVLDIFRPIQSKSVQWLSLDESVDKIRSFHRPARRNFRALDLDLLSQDALSYVSSVSSGVWSPAKHTFVANDAHSKVVYCNSVRLFAHYFWSHIPWSSRGIF